MPTRFKGGISADSLAAMGIITTGSIFYVDNSNSQANDGNPGDNPNQPLSTLTRAIALCTASKGDVILLGPGHAETIATAGGITVDKAGVSIIGMGSGANRPTFSFSAVGSTFAISAASVTVRNIRVTSTVDEMVKMFHVTAAYVTLDRVDHFETASCQTIQFLLTTNAADYLTVRNCYHIQLTAAAATQVWIQLVGIDGGLIEDNTFRLVLRDHAGSFTINGSTACLGTVVRRNTIVQTSAGTTMVSAILFVDSSTGVHVHDNRAGGAFAALAGIIDVGNAGYANQNFVLDTPDKSGILDPGVDS